MKIIQLQDNHFGSYFDQEGHDVFRGKKISKINGKYKEYKYQNSLKKDEETISYTKKEIDFLKDIYYSKLNTIEEMRANGVIILGEHDDNDYLHEPLFELTNINNKDKGEESFIIETGNLMGVVRFSSKDNPDIVLQIEVGSRFDKGDKQYFLNYMLSKVFDVDITSNVSFEHGGMWGILLALVFMRHFIEACRIGLFKQYKKYEYNDLYFKGHLDLARHLRNYPLCDRITYTTHELTFDNVINQLILQAIGKIDSLWPRILSSNHIIQQNIRMLKENTTICSRSELKHLLKQREIQQTIRHPLYAQYYEPLRKISIMILKEEGFSLYSTNQTNEVEGVIFDGAWLWEEYIASLLIEQGFIHAIAVPSKEQNGIPALINQNNVIRTFYPDFYHSEKGIVLDTKYKFAATAGKREDIHQVMAYMLLLDAKVGGLVYPPILSEDEIIEANQIGIDRKLKSLIVPVRKNNPRHWCNYGFTFPNDQKIEGYDEFIRKMEEAETRFLNFLDNPTK